MMSQKRRTTHARETSAPPDVVLTNDDLLIEILIQLPILFIHLFTTVSKEWLRILKTPDFTRNRSQITKVDPLVGFLFTLNLCLNVILCRYFPDFSPKNPLWIAPSLLSPLRKLIMLRSCSLAMVCFCVVVRGGLSAGLRMAFDPTKSPHYKLVDARRTSWGMNFLKSYGYIDPMVILIQIPHMLHLEGKLVESRERLLLVCRDDICSSEFTIYEMMIWCSIWTVRCRVDTDDFMTPLLEGWSIRSTVWSIVLGEREKDSFLVINLFGKIYDCGFNQLDDNHDDDDDDDDDDELLQQFQAEHNVYEFIPSFASV
ncbi:hypothetical protein Tco_0572541 [Tanacetum coccineum]